MVNTDIASFTKQILPHWRKIKFPKRPLSKATESLLIRSCFSQNYTLSFTEKYQANTKNECRLCKSGPENIEHLFLTCPAVEAQRTELKKAIDGKAQSLRSILGLEETMRHTEIFISKSKFVETFL